MRDLNELGMRPRKRWEALRAPTDFEIAAFETQFAVHLPADFARFIKTFNGGLAEANHFLAPNGYVWEIGKFHYLLPEDASRLDLKHHPNGWEFGNMWAETRELRKTIARWSQERPAIREDTTEEVVPFANDIGNSSVFAFDCRTTTPQVCVVVVSDGFRVRKLADTFSEFVDGLF